MTTQNLSRLLALLQDWDGITHAVDPARARREWADTAADFLVDLEAEPDNPEELHLPELDLLIGLLGARQRDNSLLAAHLQTKLRRLADTTRRDDDWSGLAHIHPAPFADLLAHLHRAREIADLHQATRALGTANTHWQELTRHLDALLDATAAAARKAKPE